MSSNYEHSRAQQDLLKQHRDRGLRFLKKLCYLQLGMSAISFIVGLVAIGLGVENLQFPYTLAAPIWSAVLVAFGAVCGYLAAKHGHDKHFVPTSVKACVIIHYTVNVMCVFLVAMLYFIDIILCRKSKHCYPHETVLLAMSIATGIVGVLLALCCIMGTCYLCRYGKTLGFKSAHQHRMERRQEAVQRRLSYVRSQYGTQAYFYPQSQDQNFGLVQVPYDAGSNLAQLHVYGDVL